MKKVFAFVTLGLILTAFFGFSQTPTPVPIASTAQPTSVPILSYTIAPTTISHIIADGDCVFLVNPNTFTTSISVTTNQQLSAFTHTISYNSTLISVNTSLGTSGVTGNPNLNLTVNLSQPGKIAISGFDAAGTITGTVALYTINWIAITTGTTRIDVDTDPNNPDPIVRPPLSADVTITRAMFGDVNVDGIIDIIDALLIARDYVGLTTPQYNRCLADYNRNGTIDIVDALMVAQYYVGF
jgi:hypothetical protein